ESGLSIVEWKPVTGVVPPLDTSAWQAEFEKYKAIPQYREHNAGMSLDEFKTIYWWEWTHRLLARLVGAAFLIPLLWFLCRGGLDRAASARALVDDIRPRRSAWRGRLVDGRLGPDRAGQRVAISAGVSLDARLRHLRRHRVDGAGARAASTHRGADARTRRRGGCSRPCDRSNLSRCIGLGTARRPHLQHLAADRWEPGAGRRPPILLFAAMAQFFREHTHGAVRPPHGSLCAGADGSAARRRRRAHAEGRGRVHGGARA